MENKNNIIQGYDVFGKAYGFMLRNDLHDIDSIEHKLMQKMILLNEASINLFYKKIPTPYQMNKHELYEFSQRFKKDSEYLSIKALTEYTKDIADNYDIKLEDMEFGGKESEILKRQTDWCFDMARLAIVILDCIGIPSRFIFIANPYKAYHGHVLLEAYYENTWGLVDPLNGYIFYNDKPVSAKGIIQSHLLDEYDKDYHDSFLNIAIAEYDPNDKSNVYNVSKCNEYTYKLNNAQHNGQWIFKEDDITDMISESKE